MKHAGHAARHAALGLGIMAGLTLPAGAAEWSFAPTLSTALDTDSNRYLVFHGESSQSAALGATAELRYATETTQLSFSPELHWQLFDRKGYDNVFERDLKGGWSWNGERANASLTVEDADRSTLTTELTQTGVLSTNLHQRLDQANFASVYDETERYATIVQLGYSNVSYYGAAGEGALLDLLQGYRYPSALVGERYQLSPDASVTASVYRNDLEARLAGSSTHDSGIQIEYRNKLSERNEIDGTVGATRIETASSTRTSTTGSVTATRGYELGTLSLAYSRSFIPYGTATLVDRQQLSLSATRGLTEKLQASASASWVRNGQPLARSAPGPLLLQVQTYETVQLGLTWKPLERWAFGAELDATRTRTIGLTSEPVHDWRAALSATWTPRPFDRSY